MDKKLEQLLGEAEIKMDGWVKAINEHNRRWFHLDETTADDKSEYMNAATAVLHEITELLIGYCAAKDHFENNKMYLNLNGPALIIKSEKMNVEMQLGIDNRGMFLTGHLYNIENVRYMGDDFYRQLLSLEEIGEFEVPEHERYAEEVKAQFGDIFANGKSKLFRIVRSGIIAASKKAKYTISPQLEICWFYDCGIKEAVTAACKAFKIMYKLNYDLWKVNDLKRKGSW
ncbi:hypothetical protein KTO58_02690 [Chitinophaga pendula]|uniref:hypothetical protein n=1 Tax=Chitinophaga TaxID=79328 RepID=UPI000BAFFF25|nr:MULTISPECIES: hypothetical protein [Chitinophaga]ASZ14250.1 hypothetical protein CK934_26530 [Chitinophaga sp. MD30]UCJ08106.1 hypothetical protein KTO58_02690 [Chitinophaga pendula]